MNDTSRVGDKVDKQSYLAKTYVPYLIKKGHRAAIPRGHPVTALCNSPQSPWPLQLDGKGRARAFDCYHGHLEPEACHHAHPVLGNGVRPLLPQIPQTACRLAFPVLPFPKAKQQRQQRRQPGTRTDPLKQGPGHPFLTKLPPPAPLTFLRPQISTAVPLHL